MTRREGNVNVQEKERKMGVTVNAETIKDQAGVTEGD